MTTIGLGNLGPAGGVFESADLLDRLAGAWRELWERLEALPRTDEFWSGSNMRVTRMKVDEFAERCLRDDPSDSPARWALVASAMDAGRFSALGLIAEEVATRDEAVHDLIAVAEWLRLEIGAGPGEHLAGVLREIGRPALETIGGRAGVAALAYLDGASFPEAIGRREWELFQEALDDPPGSDPPAASSRADLEDAARWWSRHRGVDVTERLVELRAHLTAPT